LPNFSHETHFSGYPMSPPRFLVDSLAAGAVIELGPEESVHAVRVLRLGIGSHVELFDGRGTGAAGEIVSQARRQVAVRVGGALRTAEPSQLAIGLCVALPRGDRQQQLVEIASQLAVQVLVPVVTERSVHQPSEKGHIRLNRWAMESAKQCGP
jgi:16S rRNA (uracil1498-N3)-methyltransferase